MFPISQQSEREINLKVPKKIPKKIRCKLGLPWEGRICDVDAEGWGSCGDSVIDKTGELCVWCDEVLEWQERQGK